MPTSSQSNIIRNANQTPSNSNATPPTSSNPRPMARKLSLNSNLSSSRVSLNSNENTPTSSNSDINSPPTICHSYNIGRRAASLLSISNACQEKTQNDSLNSNKPAKSRGSNFGKQNPNNNENVVRKRRSSIPVISNIRVEQNKVNEVDITPDVSESNGLPRRQRTFVTEANLSLFQSENQNSQNNTIAQAKGIKIKSDSTPKTSRASIVSNEFIDHSTSVLVESKKGYNSTLGDNAQYMNGNIKLPKKSNHNSIYNTNSKTQINGNSNNYVKNSNVFNFLVCFSILITVSLFIYEIQKILSGNQIILCRANLIYILPFLCILIPTVFVLYSALARANLNFNRDGILLSLLLIINNWLVARKTRAIAKIYKIFQFDLFFISISTFVIFIWTCYILSKRSIPEPTLYFTSISVYIGYLFDFYLNTLVKTTPSKFIKYF